MKLILDKSAKRESGAMLENGIVTPYTTVDLTDTIEHVKKERELYNMDKPKDLHHIASIPVDLIENIRIFNKYPQGQEGFDLALKEAVRMVKSGELEAFKIHEY